MLVLYAVIYSVYVDLLLLYVVCVCVFAIQKMRQGRICCFAAATAAVVVVFMNNWCCFAYVIQPSSCANRLLLIQSRKEWTEKKNKFKKKKFYTQSIWKWLIRYVFLKLSVW